MKYLHPSGFECLTKENFWDEIKAKYPDEFEHFSKWLDEYKAKVQWTSLFKNHHALPSRGIKYHDLPIAMQFGIFFEYLCGVGSEFVVLNVIQTRQCIGNCIKGHFSFIHSCRLINHKST